MILGPSERDVLREVAALYRAARRDGSPEAKAELAAWGVRFDFRRYSYADRVRLWNTIPRLERKGLLLRQSWRWAKRDKASDKMQGRTTHLMLMEYKHAVQGD